VCDARNSRSRVACISGQRGGLHGSFATGPSALGTAALLASARPALPGVGRSVRLTSRWQRDPHDPGVGRAARLTCSWVAACPTGPSALGTAALLASARPALPGGPHGRPSRRRRCAHPGRNAALAACGPGCLWPALTPRMAAGTHPWRCRHLPPDNRRCTRGVAARSCAATARTAALARALRSRSRAQSNQARWH
jgi:hypothetical protein